MMIYSLAQLPTVLVLSLLGVIFFHISQHWRHTSARLWHAGWCFILAHFVIRMLAPVGRMAFSSVLDVGTLQTGAMMFALADSSLSARPRSRYALAALVLVPLLTYSTAAVLGGTAPLFLAVSAALAYFGCAALAYVLHRGKPWRQWVTASPLLLIGLLVVVETLRDPAWASGAGIYCGLATTFGFAGLGFWKSHRRGSVAVVTTVVGFLAAASVFPAAQWASQRAVWTISPDLWNVPKLFIAIGMILTILEEQRLAERDAHKRFEALFQTANDLVLTTDCEGRITLANRLSERFLGMNPEQLQGHAFASFLDSAREPVRALWTRKGDSRAASIFEATLRPRDGQSIPVEISSSPLVVDGSPCGRVSIIRDLRERQELEEQLRQAQRIETVGRLAGGVAHDFNNILMVIAGYGELLQESEDPQKLHRYAQKIREAAARGSGVTQQLLAFSRKQVIAPRVQNLNTILEQHLSLLRPLVGENIALECDFAPSSKNVRIDRGQMEQVVMNLVVNARDAMPSGGTVRIATKNITVRGDSAAPFAELPEGSYVCLSVSDTGPGIEPQVRQHIFEPFFTTKPVNKGTGLGLAMAYGFVKQSGGHIFVESELGRGATFTILLPTVDEGCADETTPEEQPLCGRETILLAEDEDDLRDACAEFLQRMGYRVVVAANGNAAVAAAEGLVGRLDLLISDVVMPDMNGSELAARIRQLDQNVRVLLVSGYTADALPILDSQRGFSFLQKPFSFSTLARRLRQVLGGPGQANSGFRPAAVQS